MSSECTADFCTAACGCVGHPEICYGNMQPLGRELGLTNLLTTCQEDYQQLAFARPAGSGGPDYSGVPTSTPPPPENGGPAYMSGKECMPLCGPGLQLRCGSLNALLLMDT